MFKNKYGEVRSGWGIVIGLALWLFGSSLLGVGLGVFLGFQAGVEYGATGSLPAIDPAVIQEKAAAIGSAPLFRCAALALGILAILLAFRIVYGKRPLSQMGLSPKSCFPQLLGGCLLGAVSMALAFVLLLVTGSLNVVSIQWNALGNPLFWASFVMFFLVALNEEILCRGYMMTALKTTRSRAAILFVSSIIFSLLHLFNPNLSGLGLFNIALIGIVFALQLIQTGRLWVPIGFHFLWNFVQGNVLGMNVSGMETVSILQSEITGPWWWTGGAFGPEGGLAVTAVALLNILIALFLLRPKETLPWALDSELPMVRPRRAK